MSGQSPADGSSTSDTTPTFSWNAVLGAAEYEWRISDSQSGLDSAASVSVTGTSHTPTSALTNLQTYYWQVRVKKTGGQYGPWSVGQSLKVEWGTVSGQSPGDGSTTWNTTPELSWTEVTDAAGYEVRIADSAGGLAIASSNGVTDLSYTPLSALTIGQTHYWQVRAKDGTDQYGAWSDAYSLRVESDAVSGQSPADGSSSWDTTPTFIWDAVPGAAEYELRIADSPAGLASATSIRITTGSTHTPVSALTIGQAHYWQVRAKDGTDQYGAWSDAYSLRVESDAVNGRSPADGNSTWDTTPTFSWDAVPGAAEYELRIADSSAELASATSIRVTTGSTHTPVSALTIGQAHYWQVRAKDGTGQFGEWSEAHSLRVESNAVNGQNPADGSSTTDTTPTFSWDTVPGAAGYELQLADSLAGVETAQTQHVTDTSYTVSSVLAKGQTHYWRVRAKDGTGQYGAWSAIVAIQIDYSIGDTGPAGEIVFYDKGSYSDGWRYLEATSSDQSTGIKWGEQGTLVEGTSTAIGSGKSNTEKIVNKLGLGNYAARLCYDLELGGFDDWFLPSKDELKELYKQKNIIGGFETSYLYYWSSFEEDSAYAWLHTFDNNYQSLSNKNSGFSVRAVRYF